MRVTINTTAPAGGEPHWQPLTLVEVLAAVTAEVYRHADRRTTVALQDAASAFEEAAAGLTRELHAVERDIDYGWAAE